ncbi:MAG: alanine racemase [Polyangiaceae bacterium]|nr:alanine racemase [Polyangiaceae bacterium]
MNNATERALQSLETPHALVDEAKMLENIRQVAEYAQLHGIAHRPHVKTHKSRWVASQQLKAGAQGLTCATSREAEEMATICDDLLIAYPPVDPRRIERLLALPSRVRLSFALDSLTAIQRIARATEEKNRTVDLLLEIDFGGKRTGLAPHENLTQLIEAINASATLRWKGLFFHAGNLLAPRLDHLAPQTDRNIQELEEGCKSLDRELNELLARLKAEGHVPEVVSGGNTPTLYHGHLIRGMTEMRAGTYVFSDRDIASQGVCATKDCAYSLLATVISTQVPGQAVVDAGTKAVAKEVEPGLEGYGYVAEYPEVIVREMNEEHGILDLSNTAWRPAVGDRVQIVPNHVCVSVHLQDEIAYISESGNITVRPVDARGRPRKRID